MAQNKILNVPQTFLAAAAANVLSPGAAPASAVGYTSSAPYIILKHIRVVNNDTGAPHTVSLFIGATGASVASTAFAWSGASIPAAGAGNTNWLDWYGQRRIDTADFLTGVCDTASKVTIEIDAEIGLA